MKSGKSFVMWDCGNEKENDQTFMVSSYFQKHIAEGCNEKTYIFFNWQDWSATWISNYCVHLNYTHKLQYTNYKTFNHVYLVSLRPQTKV